MLKLISIPLVTLMLAGCSSAPPAPKVDLAAEQAKIRDLETAWNQELSAKDVEKIVSHYTDDSALMIPGAPMVKGKDGARTLWKGMIEDPNLKMSFAQQAFHISESGDLAITRGSYTMVMSDPKTKKPVDDKGSYVTVYKKQADGSWKVVEDIAVSEHH